MSGRELRSLAAPAVLAAALLLPAGCGRHAERSASTLTEHQRDSVLATEPIPGASAVGGALRAVDKEAAHATAVDSMTR